MGFAALHILSWSDGVQEGRHQATKKLWGQLMQDEWFVAIKIIYMETSITTNIYEIVF